jgi:HPt (histidine-containing phosphotransfer) domain-containing protein
VQTVMPTMVLEGRDDRFEPAARVGDSPRRPDAPIDWAHLARFTLDDKALEYEVLGLFAMDAPRYLAKLYAATDGRDWVEAAHTLKGSARAVGAWAVAECAEAAEKLPQVKRGAPVDFAGNRGLTEILERLASAVRGTVAYIESLADPNGNARQQ